MKDILASLRVETRRVAVRSTDWLGLREHVFNERIRVTQPALDLRSPIGATDSNRYRTAAICVFLVWPCVTKEIVECAVQRFIIVPCSHDHRVFVQAGQIEEVVCALATRPPRGEIHAARRKQTV